MILLYFGKNYDHSNLFVMFQSQKGTIIKEDDYFDFW